MVSKSKLKSASLLSVTALASILAISGCKKDSYKASETQTEMVEIASVDDLMLRKPKNEDEAMVAKGIKALSDGDLKLASRTFNTLLIDSPMDPSLHTLNGLTYQLMAEQGEVTKLTLAQAGFEQALKIEPHMVIASMQLGRIYAQKKDFVKAQEYFSDVLIHNADHKDAYYELAASSYKLGDLKTAVMSIDQAISRDAQNPDYVRAAAMIYAALGNGEQAQLYSSRYSTLNVSNYRKKHLERRVNDWLTLHESGRYVAQADSTTPEAPAALPQAAPDPSPSTEAPAAADAAADADPAPVPATEPADLAEPPVPAAAPAEPAYEPKPHVHPRQEIWKEKNEDMVVIDAVLMRVSEIGTTRKGNNIMESLKMVLVPGNFFKGRGLGAAGGFKSSTVNLNGTNGGPSFSAAYESTTAGQSLITQGLSFGTIEYSLNIANSRDQYAEVIARPTLTAMVDKPAKFSSGRNRKIAVNGQFGGNITETPIGTSIEVKVLEYKDGFITLDIKVVGSSFEQGDTLPSDSSSNRDNGTVFTLNEDSVSTVVKVRAGESVMLGGITQRELKTSKDGVPILQSIPLIQYFFSQESTESDRKSVMIILTPRSYKETIKETKTFFARGQEFGRRPKLTEFERRHKDWYDPSINNTLILDHLGPVYDEFRTGDLHSIKWGHKDNVDQQLISISNFLYY